MDRKVIEASEGMYLTNGTVYGKKIYLAEGMSEAEFHEVTEEAYKNVLGKEAELQAQKYQLEQEGDETE